LFGSGSSLSPIPGYGYPQSDPGIAYPCFDWAGSTQAHTGQAGSAQPLQVRFVQNFGSTRPALHPPDLLSTGSAHCSAVQLVSDLVQVKSGPVQFVAVRFRPVQFRFSTFQCRFSTFQPVRFNSFQAGSAFQAGSVLFQARSVPVSLSPGLFVSFFASFTHFLDCVLVFGLRCSWIHFVVDSTQNDYY
jgi:hypothetical protein